MWLKLAHYRSTPHELSNDYIVGLQKTRLVKRAAQVRFIEKASMYTRFFKSVGLRCMDISNMAQAAHYSKYTS